MNGLIVKDSTVSPNTIVLFSKGIFSKEDKLFLQTPSGKYTLQLQIQFKEDIDENEILNQRISNLRLQMNSSLVQSLENSYILEKNHHILTICKDMKNLFQCNNLENIVSLSLIDVFSEKELLFNKLDFLKEMEEVDWLY